MNTLCVKIIFGMIISVKSKHILITIPDGDLKGSVMTNYDEEQFYGFTSVPFARPPLGEYRFEAAKQNKPWTGTLDATKPSPACIQPYLDNTVMIGQEDCLYLNVFTKYLNQDAHKAVLIYIHGGNFLQGRASIYGPEFILTEDIVFVTINYRVGVYGFLNTGHSMSGNNAFLDQVLALKWVQKNIQYFGGNPNKITISGESAGGMSVHAHILSPISTGLFHQAIVMSGALLPEVQTAENTAIPIAEYLGLPTNNYNAMMKSLKNASNEDLFEATNALKWFELRHNQPILAASANERPGKHTFIPDYPFKLLQSGKYNQVPLMIGGNNREGLFMYAPMQDQPDLKDFVTSVPFYLNDRKQVLRKIRKFYNMESMDGPRNAVDFYSDIWFRYQTFRAAREHAKTQNSPVYCYQFSGDGELNYLKKQYPIIKDKYGACHADELGYLFKCAGVPTRGSKEEKLMRTMVKMWTSFTKYGKVAENLQPFTVNNRHYVNITNEGLKYAYLNTKTFKFWDNIYEEHSVGLW